MGESGYTREQRFTMLRLSTEMNAATIDYLEKHPVHEWLVDDWQCYELSQWDCTDKMRTSLLIEMFTPEQADAIAEAWEHERYIFRTVQDGYGRMHHCRFCQDVVI